MISPSQGVGFKTQSAPYDRTTVNMWSWRPWIVAFCCMSWVGMPLALVGVPDWASAQLVAVFIVVSTGLFLLNKFRFGPRFSIFDRLSILLFVYTILVSIVSTNFFFSYGLGEWLPALYALTPILLCFSFRFFEIRVQDIINGILVASTFVALVVLFDRFFPLSQLNVYRRLSSFDENSRRIVIMKTEVAIATCFFFCRIFEEKKIYIKIISIFGFFINLYYLSIVAESRLVLFAIALALSFYIIFLAKGSTRIYMIYACVTVGIIAYPYLGAKYVDAFISDSQYLQRDSSVAWRLLTLDYYRNFFEQTYGFGFGILSQSPNKENFVAFSTNFGGALFGDQHYNIYMADTGMWGALYQFGYLGFTIVVVMTFIASFTLIYIGRRGYSPYRRELGIAGALMLFLFLSPWPINFFTLQWSCMPGAIFWSLACLGWMEQTSFRARLEKS